VLLYLCVHLNQIGVPDFVKEPVLRQLRERGVELDFSRMRVRLTRGLVAENVNVTRKGETQGEVIYAGELQLKLDWRDLRSFKAPGLRAVTVRDGRISLPLNTGTNANPFPFKVDNLRGRLRFDGAELWTLEQLEGTCHGGRFRAAGSVANASRWVRREPKEDRPKTTAGSFRGELLRYARALDRMTFSQPPELDLKFHADAANAEQSTLAVVLTAAGAESELGRFEQLRLTLDAGNATNGTPEMLAHVSLESASAKTRWGGLQSLRLELQSRHGLTNPLPLEVGLDVAAERVSARGVQLDRLELKGSSSPADGETGLFATTLEGKANGVFTEWARLTNAGFKVEARHPVAGPATNWLPQQTRVALDAEGVSTRWAQAGRIALGATARPAATDSARGLEAWWSRLEPFELEANVRLAQFTMPKLAVDSAALAVGWSNGAVVVRDLTGQLYGGNVRADASVDVASRFAAAKVFSDFDLHRLEPLLTTNAVKWIRQYGWRPEQPVVLTAEGSAVLPAWTNRQPDWRGEVLPTLRIAGTATVTNFNFRGLPGDRGFVPFAHTNLLWTIRNARAWRPEGEVEFDYEGHTLTQDYHFRVRSSVDPNLVRPLLEPGGVRTLEMFQFTQPPHLEGDIWGRWFARERTGFAVRLSLTNVTFRGESVDEFRGSASFTNQFVDIRNVDIKRGATWAQVPSAGFDAATKRIYLTNAMATLDVAPVTRVIGPKTHKMMSAYQFDQPLRAVVNGVIPVGNTDEADVKFEASLGGFHWWRFNTTNTSALLHWQGDRISVSNLDTGFHGGRLNGNIWVNTENKEDVQFGFDATGKDLDVASLLRDLLPNTNRLEGILSTHLVVDRASARDDGAWTGRGEARLKDGYLWGLPLFGVLSGPLEAISPGLGAQKFSEGVATFHITNRVVISRDLELKSPVMRMRFNGEVGFDAHLDTRMEVEPLRDLPVLGGLVSTVLKPFTKLLEFEVKGRLGKPEADFRHVPSFILAPLRPLQTLKALFPEESTETPAKPEAEPKPEPTTPPPVAEPKP
jgi:hypothetical protein